MLRNGKNCHKLCSEIWSRLWSSFVVMPMLGALQILTLNSWLQSIENNETRWIYVATASAKLRKSLNISPNTFNYGLRSFVLLLASIVVNVAALCDLPQVD